jgi:arsenite-transporting ATPase
VGKTTCAAAKAIGAAESGQRVLLISTDPAHSLRDVLAAPPGRIATRGGTLSAVELNADRALSRWLAAHRPALHAILARGTYLDDEDIDRFLGLSLPGVNELMGLAEVRRLAEGADWDVVVVDTAPTGHTLRLLQMPVTLGRLATILDGMLAKHRFLAESLAGARAADASDALIAELEEESRTLAGLLRDRRRCAFAWLLVPEALALDEARDGVSTLLAAGLPVAEILVNRVAAVASEPCPLCTVRRRQHADVVAQARAAFKHMAVRLLSELPAEPRGVAALRRLSRALARPATADVVLRARLPTATRPSRARGCIGRQRPRLDRIVPSQLRLLLFAGKGGVGKTTCAAAVALALAARDPARRILLLSADPAHSLADVLRLGQRQAHGAAIGDATPVPGARGRLRVLELDADAALARRQARYRDAVDELFAMLRAGSRFDIAFDRAVLRDLIELAPSGLDELFSVLAVVDALAPGAHGRPPYDTVIVDTAPTGHALRLLELPATALPWAQAFLGILLKYRKVIGLGELGWDLIEISRRLNALQTLLRDPSQTRLVAVTRSAEVVRLETERLLAAVHRLGIAVAAVVVNAQTPSACARCRRAARGEAAALVALRRACRPPRSPRRQRCAIIEAPAVAPPPRGAKALARWRARWEIEPDDA